MQSLSAKPAMSPAVAARLPMDADVADMLASHQPCEASFAAALGWLALDEIDYGIVVLGRGGEVLHANRRARAEFEAGGHALALVEGRLKARCNQDGLRLAEALHAVNRGLRRLVEMGPAGERVNVALVPLSASAGGPPAAALLLLGRRCICEDLSVQSFARTNDLTLAETRVLEALCAGETAGALARRQGVAVSTVRTHIASIRAKTGTSSVQELVRRVAALPPLLSALRMAD